jgi:hypothetical protein
MRVGSQWEGVALENNFGLHFDTVEDGKRIKIEASFDGKMVAGGEFTAEQVDEILAALADVRRKMRD